VALTIHGGSDSMDKELTSYQTYLLSELHRYHKTNSKIPSARDFGKGSGYPSVQAYKNQFRSWSEAITTAGYTPPQTRWNSERVCLRDVPVKSSHVKPRIRSISGYIPPTKLSSIKGWSRNV